MYHLSSMSVKEWLQANPEIVDTLPEVVVEALLDAEGKDETIASLEERVNELEGELADKDKEISKLEKEIDMLEEAERELQEEIAELLADRDEELFNE